MLDFKLTTFTDSGRTHEAIGVSWADVTELLNEQRRALGRGLTELESLAVLVQALLEAGAPAWVATASGAIDELGWYLLGPEVAEPLLESELGGFNGDHVAIGEETYAVDTEEQIGAVARMLHRLDLPEQPVYRGAPPDTVKTTLRIIPRT
jgi:hypothetical protein